MAPREKLNLGGDLDIEDGVAVDAASTKEDKASLLARLGAELAAVATDDAKATAKLNEIETVLKNIKVGDYPSLAESPAVQAFVQMMGGGLRPGEVKNRGTLAEVARDWTARDFAEQFSPKTFTPNESLPLTINGVTYYVRADEEVTLPEPFYGLYMEHKRALRQRETHENYMLGYSDQPPDPNYLVSESARVRAFSLSGPQPNPRARGTGPINTQEPADNG